MILNSNFVVQPNDLVLLAVSGDSLLNGGIEPDIVYSEDDIQLANSNDEIMLLAGGTLIDEILYDGGSNSAWPSPTGASFAFNQMYSSSAANSATDNDNFNFWCVSANPYGDGSQLGTPGESNDCP